MSKSVGPRQWPDSLRLHYPQRRNSKIETRVAAEAQDVVRVDLLLVKDDELTEGAWLV